jgi:hypothetical protein
MRGINGLMGRENDEVGGGGKMKRDEKYRRRDGEER